MAHRVDKEHCVGISNRSKGKAYISEHADCSASRQMTTTIQSLACSQIRCLYNLNRFSESSGTTRFVGE